MNLTNFPRTHEAVQAMAARLGIPTVGKIEGSLLISHLIATRTFAAAVVKACDPDPEMVMICAQMFEASGGMLAGMGLTLADVEMIGNLNDEDVRQHL